MDTVKQMLRSNWHLLCLMAGLFAAGVWFAARPEAPGGVEAITVDAELATNLSKPDFRMESRWSMPTRDKKIALAMEEYENELKYNRESEETPANLFRLANLYYSHARDYEKAALYYEALIQEFPDFPAMTAVYPNLLTCYTRLGKDDVYRSTLRRMMDHFGPDTQEHAFAKQELGM